MGRMKKVDKDEKVSQWAWGSQAAQGEENKPFCMEMVKNN